MVPEDLRGRWSLGLDRSDGVGVRVVIEETARHVLHRLCVREWKQDSAQQKPTIRR